MGKEMGERFKRKRIYIYLCQFMLRFDRKQQNSVNQLSFNKKKIKKKFPIQKKEKCLKQEKNFCFLIVLIPILLSSSLILIKL